MLADYLKIAFKSIRTRKMRSWLTIIGIIVSIASIVTLVFLGQGLNRAITGQFEQLGSNYISVFPKGGDPTTFAGMTTDDVETIERLPMFDNVLPFLMKRGVKVEYGNELEYNHVAGMPPEDLEPVYEQFDIGISEGRFMNKGEKYVAMVGWEAATDLFDRELRVKTKIKLNDIDFRVVGILERVGNQDDDNNILIPMDTAREVFDMPDEVTAIQARVKEGYDVDESVARLEREFERHRGKDDLQVFSAAELLEIFNSVLGGLTALLSGIAFISLIVGAIGIMNSTYTNVFERTNEIGIMKSVGARNSDILLMFVIETGMIGFVGGLIGTILGVILAFIAGAAINAANFLPVTVHADPLWILIALAFATTVGMVSGFLPAWRAAKLQPVEALRAL